MPVPLNDARPWPGRGLVRVILLLVLVVVVPAVWSVKGYRRRAGLDVLVCLLP